MRSRPKCTSADEIGRVSAEVIGDLFGVSRVTFAKWCNEGVLARQSPSHGYDLRVVCRALLKDYARRAAGRGEEGEQRVLSSARARAADAQAEERRLRVDILKGRYVSVLAVRQVWANVAESIREVALSVPGKIAHALSFHTKEDQAAVEEIVYREICEMLERLADGNDVKGDVVEDDEAVQHGRSGRVARNGRGENREGFGDVYQGRGVDQEHVGAGRVAGRAVMPPRSNSERMLPVLLQRDGGGIVY
jgi:phage terminase Nu1 subunit (DNA packaging protein)